MRFSKYKIDDLVTSIKTGKTPSTKEPLYFDGELLWVTPSDLKGQKYIYSTERNISEMALIDNQSFLFKENTILISCIGDIGKAAIVRTPSASNQQITGLTVNEKIILPVFFYYWVIRNKQLLNFRANKAIMSILNNKVLRSISIEIPTDIEFQRKIATQLDTIQDLIDKRVKSIELLDESVKSKYFNLFGDPANNQIGFKRMKLSEIVKRDKIITYGIVQAGPEVEGGVPYIKSGNIKNGKILIDQLSRTSIEIASKYERSKCRSGDIIISIRASVGECAILPEEIDGANLTQGTARISPNMRIVNTNYLFQTLSSDGFKFLIKKYIKGSTFKEISLTKLREIQIPIPEIDLQNEFSETKYQLDLQRLILEKSLSLLKDLFQSILKNAFGKEVDIDEKPIFKDLIKDLSIEDLQGNKNRLQFLIDLFNEQEFENLEIYSDTKEKLFELMAQGKIGQKIMNDELILHVE